MPTYLPPPPPTASALKSIASVVALGAAATAAQAANICDRTPQVQQAVLSSTSADDTCDDVNLGGIRVLRLRNKGIVSLKAGDFAGFPSTFRELDLRNNPGGPFRFVIRFDPPRLPDDFESEEVKLVVEGATRVTWVQLSAAGARITKDGESFTWAIFSPGDTESQTFTVTRQGEGSPRITQSSLWFPNEGQNTSHEGYSIVRGPEMRFGGIEIKIRVFLEGARE